MSLSDNYQVDSTAGNGATTIFTGSWSPLVSTYMRVYLQLISTGALGTALVQGAGAGEYTLTFTSSGYSITLGTAASALYNVVRAREVAIDQSTPYTTAKGFQGLVTENSFDKITAICQDLRDDVNRSLRFQIGDDLSGELPPVVTGDAGKVFAINTALDGIELLTPNSSSYLSVSAYILTLLDDATAADARTTLGVGTTSTPQFARIGLGQAADSSAVMAATGQYFSALATTTTTLDWNSGNSRQITLASGGQTFTFANGKSGGRYIIKLKQPSGGAAGTVTWPASVLWPSAAAPTLTVTNNKVDIVSFFYDGTNYFAASNLNY